MKKIFLLAPLFFVFTACESTHHTKHSENSSYWQRTDMTSALYVRGPKAQHMLHKDISSCVTEVKELSRLGTIRDANPPGGIEMNVGLADKWQSPRGDGPLYTEFRDFHDFESCMNYKGWRRMNYVSPEHMEKAKTNYNTVILGKTYDQDIETHKKYYEHDHNQQANYNN
jgi:hypothetical protein